MASAVSQPWDAGSDADRKEDANGTLLPLVELGKVPTDGTWEILHGGGVGWAPFTAAHGLAGSAMDDVLVVARPIGSDNGN